MNHLTTLLAILLLAMLNQTGVPDQARPVLTRDLPCASPANPRQMVDIDVPKGATNLAVASWIHGGGWEAGDWTAIQLKPQAFVDKGFVFVSGQRACPRLA